MVTTKEERNRPGRPRTDAADFPVVLPKNSTVTAISLSDTQRRKGLPRLVSSWVGGDGYEGISVGPRLAGGTDRGAGGQRMRAAGRGRGVWRKGRNRESEEERGGRWRRWGRVGGEGGGAPRLGLGRRPVGENRRNKKNKG